VERGYDPQDFTLVAFGGAGPLHAVDLARELGIPRVMVPPSAGTLCSLGLLQTDIRTDHVCSRLLNPAKVDAQEVKDIFSDLKAQGKAVLEKENVAEQDRKYLMWVESRYRRQNYELMIPVEEADFTPEGLKDICARFHAEHQKTYGYARPAAEVEFVNFRLAAVGQLPKAVISRQPGRASASVKAALLPKNFRPVYFKSANDFIDCAIYDRKDFYAGDTFSGPAIVEQMDATTVIPPDVRCEVDDFGNMMLIL
jgi:N-methylhydantoinase A